MPRIDVQVSEGALAAALQHTLDACGLRTVEVKGNGWSRLLILEKPDRSNHLRIKTVADLFREGKTHEQIAEALGVLRETVTMDLRAAGIPRGVCGLCLEPGSDGKLPLHSRDVEHEPDFLNRALRDESLVAVPLTPPSSTDSSGS